MSDAVAMERLFPVHQEQLSSDDYYTPAWVFERMGISFDLDVCAPPGGIAWIPAVDYLTMADDGLTAPWVGRVWMNPPFSDAEPWVDRLIAHRNGVALLPYVKAFWRNRIWAAADGIADLADVDRIKFAHRGKPTEIMFPTFFAAFGPECVEAIGRLGVVRTVAV